MSDESEHADRCTSGGNSLCPAKTVDPKANDQTVTRQSTSKKIQVLSDSDSDSDFTESSLKVRAKTVAKATASRDWQPAKTGSAAAPCPCFLCGKKLAHMSVAAAQQHINSCLDKTEDSDELEKKIADWCEIVDCPVCKQPLPPEPAKIAHLKKCGAAKKLRPAQLVNMLRAQLDDVQKRKKAGLSHTVAPQPTKESLVKRPSKRDELMPRNPDAESLQLALALSKTDSDCDGSLLQPDPLDELIQSEQRPIGGPSSSRMPDSQIRVEADCDDLVSCRLTEVLAESAVPQGINPSHNFVCGQSSALRLYPYSHLLYDIPHAVTAETEPPWQHQPQDERPVDQLNGPAPTSSDSVATNAELHQWLLLRDELLRFRKSQRNGGDLMLCCSDGSLFAHAVFLETRAPLLYARMRPGKSDKDISSIDLTRWSRDVIESLLDFVYAADAPQVQKNAAVLLDIAREFNIGHLELFCESFLQGRVKTELAEDMDTAPADSSGNEIDQAEGSNHAHGGDGSSDKFEQQNHAEGNEVVDGKDEDCPPAGIEQEGAALLPLNKSFSQKLEEEEQSKAEHDCQGAMEEEVDSEESELEELAETTRPLTTRESSGSSCDESLDQMLSKMRPFHVVLTRLEDEPHSPVLIATPEETPVKVGLSCREKLNLSARLDQISVSLQTVVANNSGGQRRSPRRRMADVSTPSITADLSTPPVIVLSDEDNSDAEDSFLRKVPLDNLSGIVSSTPVTRSARKTAITTRTKTRPLGGWRRVAHGTAKMKIIKTANITPRPNYSMMATPELTAALGENGVKKLPKRQAKNVLKKIFDDLHPVIDISNTHDDDDSDVEEVEEEVTRPAKRAKLMAEEDKANEMVGIDISSDQSCSSASLVVAPVEESLMLTDVESTDSETQEKPPPLGNLIDQVREFLHNDANLRKKLLCYEPLLLKQLHAVIKAAGIRCSVANLMTVLDKLCVSFTSKDIRAKPQAGQPKPKPEAWGQLLSSKKIFKK